MTPAATATIAAAVEASPTLDIAGTTNQVDSPTATTSAIITAPPTVLPATSVASTAVATATVTGVPNIQTGPVSEPSTTSVPDSATATSAPTVTRAPKPPTAIPPTNTHRPPPTNTPSTAITPDTPPDTTAPAPTAISTPTLIPTVPASGNLSEIFRGPAGRKYVAITFDAGGGFASVPLLLNTLRSHGTHLTFFLTGRWVSENPTYAQQIAADGHEIANHSFDHPDLTKLSDDAVRQEISTAEATITSITGINPKPLFRSPYGAENKHTVSIIQSMGYRPVFWSLDTLDSVGQPKSVQFLVDRIKNASNASLDGGIILIHVGLTTSAQAIGPILDNLASRGFTVVTISRLIS